MLWYLPFVFSTSQDPQQKILDWRTDQILSSIKNVLVFSLLLIINHNGKSYFHYPSFIKLIHKSHTLVRPGYRPSTSIPSTWPKKLFCLNATNFLRHSIFLTKYLNPWEHCSVTLRAFFFGQIISIPLCMIMIY